MSASGERLDDAHATAAARTDPVHVLRRGGFGAGRGAACVGFGARPSGRVGGRDQVPQAPDGCGASGAGEEAVVADAVEAAGQHVEKEAADELVGRERHGLEPVAAFDPIVLPPEGDAVVVEPDQTRIRDRDAVGVAGQVGEDGLWSGERPLGVDDPCDRESSGEENEHEVLKPFIAIQRVQLPPGKG
jgi:hypothetical protein